MVIANAEPLLPDQRVRIAETFGCDVRDTYGMAEAVVGASECEQGGSHLWPEVGITEIDDESRLICTSLLNADMPLVRYAVGDRALSAPAGERCACGRALPLAARIEGRLDDVVVTPDGRRVGRLDPVFKSDFPIREAQITQESPERVRVRVVAAAGFDHRTPDRIRAALRQRLGKMEVAVEQVDRIPRGANGKFREVVSMVQPQEA